MKNQKAPYFTSVLKLVLTGLVFCLNQVEALQRDLHLTRIALCKQRSASSCKCNNANNTHATGRHASEEEFPCMSLLRGGDAASGSSTAASETSSTWETVDESETKPTLWVPDHAAVECMGLV